MTHPSFQADFKNAPEPYDYLVAYREALNELDEKGARENIFEFLKISARDDGHAFVALDLIDRMQKNTGEGFAPNSITRLCIDALRYTLDLMPDPKEKKALASDCLESVVKLGWVDCLSVLVNCGAFEYSDAKTNAELLAHATGNGNAQMVECMLEQGLDPNASDLSLLYHAIFSNHLHIIPTLLAGGVHINHQHHPTGQSALHLAVCAYSDVAGGLRKRIIEDLIKAGIDETLLDDTGLTAERLTHEIGKPHLANCIVKCLSERSAASLQSATPLARSSSRGVRL